MFVLCGHVDKNKGFAGFAMFYVLLETEGNAFKNRIKLTTF